MNSHESAANKQKLDPKITVKVEPDSSTPIPVASIKVEAGPSTTRLTSFRAPRDLTLGGQIKLEKPKKLYTPNLNVQRNKNKDERPTIKNNVKQVKDRVRGRGQGQRGRGRGKASDNIIQTEGVFSEGISNNPRYSRRQSGYGSSTSDSGKSILSTLVKPKLNLDPKINKADEEEKLKNLLRDDFIENGAIPDMENAPMLLPMADEVKLYKEEIVEELEKKLSTDDSSDVDVKPVLLENGEVKSEAKKLLQPVPKKGIKEEKKPITIPQLLASENNNYMLLQFPDCLPGLRTDDALKDTRQKKSADSTAETDSNATSDFCTLSNLKEGLLGKLQIHQSGRAKLILGDNKLLMEVGSHISFRQDLIATRLDVENLNGELINLGKVGSTLICSPDWESMLENV